jgi:hypothetical protein
MKIGKIKITDTLVLKDTLSLLPLFSKFVPIRIDTSNLFYFVYMGICEDFKDIEEGDEIPYYICTFTGDTHKTMKVTFEIQS